MGPPDPEMERAALAGSPTFHSTSLNPDIAETLEYRQARILTQRYAIGDCLAAELALIVWGACPR
jgi:hypothetical protein